MFTNNILETEDFYFTGDDYRYRFTQNARRRFVHHLREHFKTKFGSHPHNWDVVMSVKAIELGQFLMHRTNELDFTEPAPILKAKEAIAA